MSNPTGSNRGRWLAASVLLAACSSPTDRADAIAAATAGGAAAAGTGGAAPTGTTTSTGNNGGSATATGAGSGNGSPTAGGDTSEPTSGGSGNATAGTSPGAGAPTTGGGGTGGSGGTTANGGTMANGGTTTNGGARGTGEPSPPACDAAEALGVHFVGRYDCVDGGVRADWSGTGFVARFSGTGINVTLDGSEAQYTVVVDGTLGPNLLKGSGAQSHELATGLADGEHTVELYRRGEASFGAVTVTGFDVGGGELLPPAPKTRRIEVVGDSITCGYGNEGDSESCPFSADTENHYLAYGALLGRQFDAEVSTVAWSGKGVVVNYGGDMSTPMPGYYELAVASDSASTWGFGWQPDVVIINLGTNDYSTDNDPTDPDFTAGYSALLDAIRGHYPETHIIATLGPLLSGTDLDTARANIAAVVAQKNEAGDDQIVTYDLAADNPSPGCDWHPDLATHEAMAAQLATPIQDALGW